MDCRIMLLMPGALVLTACRGGFIYQIRKDWIRIFIKVKEVPI